MGTYFICPAIPFVLGTVDDTSEAEANAIREAGFEVSSQNDVFGFVFGFVFGLRCYLEAFEFPT